MKKVANLTAVIALLKKLTDSDEKQWITLEFKFGKKIPRITKLQDKKLLSRLTGPQKYIILREASSKHPNAMYYESASILISFEDVARWIIKYIL